MKTATTKNPLQNQIGKNIKRSEKPKSSTYCCWISEIACTQADISKPYSSKSKRKKK